MELVEINLLLIPIDKIITHNDIIVIFFKIILKLVIKDFINK